MTRDPPPLHFVGLSQNIELFPEITIENTIAVGLYTVFFLPARQLFRHAELDVLRIGDYLHAARFLERSKAADGSFEFHAVVRGFVLETREFPLVLSEAKQAGPAARTGIAAARAVDNHSHVLLLVCVRNCAPFD